ncbi:MAG: hypothetical protein MUE73_21220 [Planctomycetes bacterium]|nr:hypothetical protein [Planctomycetota bacterium]
MHGNLRTGAPPVLLMLLCAFTPAFAKDPAAEDARFEELRKEMEDMRLRHEREMAELREEVERLKAAGAALAGDADGEIERLLRLAEGETPEATLGTIAPTEEAPFIDRGLGLQALNPEISIAGDLLTKYIHREDEKAESDFSVRVFDVHVESYLDPYTKMKVAVGLFPDDASLGEGYVTRFGVLPDLNITAGKFRQDFGVVNRWHKHALDQVDFPLPLTQIFGPGGLNQTGFSFEYRLPTLAGGTQEAILQLTEGENPRLFGQNSRDLPSALLRLKHYRDLDKDTYLELAGTALYGFNDEWSVNDAKEDDRRATMALGADISLRWEPTDRMRYANLEWRTEFYFARKSLLAPDGSGGDTVKALGVYTSLQRQLSRTVEIGIRLDYYRPDHKDYADLGIEPLAFTGRNPRRYQVSPYLTWWQSPFVKVRLEVDWIDGHHTGPSELVLVLQIVFAAGPHKHERY